MVLSLISTRFLYSMQINLPVKQSFANYCFNLSGLSHLEFEKKSNYVKISFVSDWLRGLTFLMCDLQFSSGLDRNMWRWIHRLLIVLKDQWSVCVTAAKKFQLIYWGPCWSNDIQSSSGRNRLKVPNNWTYRWLEFTTKNIEESIKNLIINWLTLRIKWDIQTFLQRISIWKTDQSFPNCTTSIFISLNSSTTILDFNRFISLQCQMSESTLAIFRNESHIVSHQIIPWTRNILEIDRIDCSTNIYKAISNWFLFTCSRLKWLSTGRSGQFLSKITCANDELANAKSKINSNFIFYFTDWMSRTN